MYLSVAQVAQKLGVTTRTVYTYIWAGRLKAHKLSERCTRIAPADLDEFLLNGMTN